MQRAIQKYLRAHAEPEARALVELLAAGNEVALDWQQGVVVPARRESPRCLEAAAEPAARARCLCVLVVNASADDPEDRRAGEALLAALETTAPRWRSPEGILALHRWGALEVLAVDRCRGQRAFGPREGVGLARKIGADLLLALWAVGRLRSAWIHNTDADARLPAEHFERTETLDIGDVAAVAPFVHVPGGEPAVDAATARYEQSLRYYVAGLRWAGSAFAHHTIGSLISVRAQAYAAVRGFPKREAGEDFYLLDKLAKLGSVRSLSGAPVRIQARRSSRVPFGTGPAVEAQLRGEALRVYDPRVFAVVAEVQRALETFAAGEGSAGLAALVEAYPEITELRACLDAGERLAARVDARQLERRLPELFDGFRTLKLIHALTAARWPKLGWDAAVAAAPFAAAIDQARAGSSRLDQDPA
ncbi:hypothetical protein G6O69_23530 [Pseudenhygromyxa sp. WMMC2535]|uniref:hypothetical protein n=1 Tax=Pseudenhygromyxa sp. WMMC2535 TaxID=2712867 RepID=UPI001557B80D|nr:hypothetical protein [Pseudenhygromyxa sp. WMMC2535]NVB40831.1 hypothetical protein [Pseudenhygromyxa sp. WMMC2535]